jgi:hypothetical protein
MIVMPAYVRRRKEDLKFKGSLCYILRSCLRKPRAGYRYQWQRVYLTV